MKLSDQIQIVRDGATFGPYTISDAHTYFERGLLFEHDLAIEVGKPATEAKPLSAVFSAVKLKTSIFPAWDQQLNLIRHNHGLLLPVKFLFSRQWFADKSIVFLMAVGCTPLLLVVFNSTLLSYVGLAAYFSVLWGFFFFSQFKTPQSKIKDAVRVFWQTPLLSALVIPVLSLIPPFSLLLHWSDSTFFLLRWTGMLLAVAVPEEICKALPVFLLVRRPGRVLQPRTVMLYGIISGLGFGIWEGVAYQLGINRSQGVDHAYFLNVLRLTSLPFIHAIWAGISSYFIGFSMLIPKLRWSLRILAILIPATLHAAHNAFPGFVSVMVDLLSVVLLMSYLGNGQTLFSGMRRSNQNTP